MKKIMRFIGKSLAFIGVFLGMTVVTLYAVILLICYGPSTGARDTLITTFLETGAFKWIPSLVMSSGKIQEIVNSNSLQALETDVDTDLIKTDTKNDTIEIKKISGSNYMATLMIVHDPSRISVATTYDYDKKQFKETGDDLDVIVKNSNSIGGINGGIYDSNANKGGAPYGLTVSKGQILSNRNGRGYHLVGFDENNVLRIISIEGMNQTQVKNLVEKEKIRDCVTFQEEASDANNHFVKLIINGERRVVKGLGSGANPRTAIGQRADGTVLMLVTDGRGSSGHLGATAQEREDGIVLLLVIDGLQRHSSGASYKDLADIMERYGAVNAANLDGGSSSVMYYNNKYLMTSVTLYYSNGSWRLPEAFVISK